MKHETAKVLFANPNVQKQCYTRLFLQFKQKGYTDKAASNAAKAHIRNRAKGANVGYFL